MTASPKSIAYVVKTIMKGRPSDKKELCLLLSDYMDGTIDEQKVLGWFVSKNTDVKDEDLPNIIEIITNGDLLKIVRTLDTERIKELSDATEYRYIADVCDEMTRMMSDSTLKESDWQKFFTKHSRVLALMIPMPAILKTDQPELGGDDIYGSGGSRGDYLYSSVFTNNSTIVEIKTPGKKLLEKGDDYRNGTYVPSRELSGSITQVLHYKHLLIEKEDGKNADAIKHGKLEYRAFEPKCIVIIGHTKELCDPDKIPKIESFENFRNSLSNIVVLTFDEVLSKLESIKNLLFVKENEDRA